MDCALAPWARPETTAMMKDGSLVSWVWFGLAILLFAIEALRPGRFALWLGFAAILVAIVASVARWPWPAELVAFVVFALVTIPAWRRYERKA
jgi:membrane protein implicated in regulation of membrane protease activity